jgi:hypothetical protein
LSDSVESLFSDHIGTPIDIRSILTANPKTKEDFIVLSRQIFELEKVASGLTALANEKQKEAKDKGKSKKKPPKPALGSTKALGKYVSDSEEHLDCQSWLQMLMFVVPGLLIPICTRKL